MATAVDLALVTDPLTVLLETAQLDWYTEQDVIVNSDTIPGIALAIAGAAASTAIQFLYEQLAQDYYDLYASQRDYYYNNFQNNGNGELGLLNQVFNSPLAGNGVAGTVYTPEYAQQDANVAYFDTWGTFSQRWWFNHAASYNTDPLNSVIDPLGNPVFPGGEPEALDVAAIDSDYVTYLYRYELHRADVYNERTWEWQNQSLNFGVKQSSIVESGLATSFRYLDEASGSLADVFATQANGLAKYSGYRSSYNTASQSLRGKTQFGLIPSDEKRRFPVMRNNISNDIMEGQNVGYS